MVGKGQMFPEKVMGDHRSDYYKVGRGFSNTFSGNLKTVKSENFPKLRRHINFAFS